METQGGYGQSAGESTRNGQSVISKAVAHAWPQWPGTGSPMNTPQRSSVTDRCPRCGKTIEAPLLLAHAKAEEYLIELIKRDHPEWVRPDGRCPRCNIYYRLLAKRTGV